MIKIKQYIPASGCPFCLISIFEQKVVYLIIYFFELKKIVDETSENSITQMIHPGRILKLRVRGTKRDLTQDTTSSEEVCVVMPGIVARFDGSHIQVHFLSLIIIILQLL